MLSDVLSKAYALGLDRATAFEVLFFDGGRFHVSPDCLEADGELTTVSTLDELASAQGTFCSCANMHNILGTHSAWFIKSLSSALEAFEQLKSIDEVSLDSYKKMRDLRGVIGLTPSIPGGFTERLQAEADQLTRSFVASHREELKRVAFEGFFDRRWPTLADPSVPNAVKEIFVQARADAVDAFLEERSVVLMRVRPEDAPFRGVQPHLFGLITTLFPFSSEAELIQIPRIFHEWDLYMEVKLLPEPLTDAQFETCARLLADGGEFEELSEALEAALALEVN